MAYGRVPRPRPLSVRLAMSEFALIDLIRERCAFERSDVYVGIGDDGAVARPPAGQDLVISADTLVAGVHFPLNSEPEDIGWKVLAVNLSDLAAMGAVPAWATLALTLPTVDLNWVRCFADGFAALARQHQVALIGGDTTQGALSISVTVHGFVPQGRAILRSGARIGDTVWVTGTLGDAAAGLHLLREKKSSGAAHLMGRLHRPTPRIAAGMALSGLATAAIDVSDGLLADLGHICRQSGVAAELQANALPGSPALLAEFESDERLDFQLSGGDDYELCFTASPERREFPQLDCPVTPIGRLVAGDGVIVRAENGSEIVVLKRGWEHFTS